MSWRLSIQKDGLELSMLWESFSLRMHATVASEPIRNLGAEKRKSCECIYL